VGCGNGRFGFFLTEHFPKLIYLGLDTDLQLLRYAQTTLSQTSLEYLLVQQDVVETPPSAGLFDVVALFGVIHHIPGEATRRALLQQLAQRVAPDGVLVFATWRFYEQARFRQRIVPWPADFVVEKHDFLLDWQRGPSAQTEALRYCHYVDDLEQTILVEATGLHEIARFRADGKSADLNCYSILKNN
jgi:SAM-dependent methyltransferase